MLARLVSYWFIDLVKLFFCKINQPILSPSLGMKCVYCHKHHNKHTKNSDTIKAGE